MKLLGAFVAVLLVACSSPVSTTSEALTEPVDVDEDAAPIPAVVHAAVPAKPDAGKAPTVDAGGTAPVEDSAAPAVDAATCNTAGLWLPDAGCEQPGCLLDGDAGFVSCPTPVGHILSWKDGDAGTVKGLCGYGGWNVLPALGSVCTSSPTGAYGRVAK